MKPGNKQLVRGDVSLDTADFGTQGNPWSAEDIKKFRAEMEPSLLEFLNE